jgi:transcriptional regulator with XRE-family HTH domain
MKTKNKAEQYTSQAIDEILKEISPVEIRRTEQRMLLASKIEDAIKAKPWKKTEFARKMKKSPSEISKWLSGTHNFTADTLSDIEDVLGIQLLDVGKKAISNTTYSISVKLDLKSDFRNLMKIQIPDLGHESLFLFKKSKVLSSMDMTLSN